MYDIPRRLLNYLILLLNGIESLGGTTPQKITHSSAKKTKIAASTDQHTTFEGQRYYICLGVIHTNTYSDRLVAQTPLLGHKNT